MHLPVWFHLSTTLFTPSRLPSSFHLNYFRDPSSINTFTVAEADATAAIAAAAAALTCPSAVFAARCIDLAFGLLVQNTMSIQPQNPVDIVTVSQSQLPNSIA